MKRSKRIYILLGVLAAVCLATFAVSRWEEQKEQIKESGECILELPADSVQSLSWEYESETLAFHRADTWLYDADEAFPVDEEKVNTMLARFEDFRAAFTIENAEDLGQYGLDEPLCRIHLATTDESYEVLLGNYSSMDSQRYVSIGDGNVYLVENDPLDSFDATLSDMIDHDETPQLTKADSITFAGAENYQISYEEESGNTYCAADVYFAQQNDRELPLDTSRVKTYLSHIGSLGLSDYVTYKATEEELASYGLDDPELTVTVNYTEADEDGEESGQAFTLQISRDPEEQKSAEAAAAEEEITAYARVGESPIVYQISGEDYRNLMAASYDSLRHREVFTADFADIQKMDITLEGVTYTIDVQKPEKEDGEYVYTWQGQEIDISALKSALTALSTDEFTAEQPTEKEEIRLTVCLNHENNPQISLQLYRYDGTHCLAVVDGEPVSLIARSYVVDLIEAVNGIVLN